MKDVNGNTIHIGEEVTFTQMARPQWLIGRHGLVEKLGDVRVKIWVPYPPGGDQSKSIRTESSKVVRGRQTITFPGIDSPELRQKISKWTKDFMLCFLENAVTRKIISKKQKDALFKYYILGIWDRDANS